MHALRLLIADNGVRARAGLRALLSTWPELEIVGEVANGREAIEFVAAMHPDLVLMDIEMPIMNGLEATHFIKRRWPETVIIILTMYPAYRSVALAAGADDFFNKSTLPEEWVARLRGVTSGEAR